MKIKYIFSSRRTRKIDPHNKHRQEYIKLAKEVVLVSDIILEVLDARFISNTKNKVIEKFVKESDKKIIYVINKSDLISVKDVKKSEILNDISPNVFISCTLKKGGKELRNKIKILAKRLKKDSKNIDEDLKLKKYRHGEGYKSFLKTGDEVYVGIIGYPNVGKSSVINLLAGAGSANVSPRSGFTKGIHKYRLSNGVMLLDTPGLITEEDSASTQNKKLAKHVLIGARTFDTAKDPDFVVTEIMKKYPGVIEKYYGIDAEGDSEILLEKLGMKWNFRIKGDKIDLDRTARQILKDWQLGKIKFSED